MSERTRKKHEQLVRESSYSKEEIRVAVRNKKTRNWLYFLSVVFLFLPFLFWHIAPMDYPFEHLYQLVLFPMVFSPTISIFIWLTLPGKDMWRQHQVLPYTDSIHQSGTIYIIDLTDLGESNNG